MSKYQSKLPDRRKAQAAIATIGDDIKQYGRKGQTT
jgi:hypothetical protein